MNSGVAKKVNKVWVWLALCRKTRQIVGYALGNREDATCRKLWKSIPAKYRRGTCYTDFFQPIKRSFPSPNTVQVEKKLDKPRIVSALTIQYANA
jgi:insertion element IS1 protein InsB